MKEKHAQQFVYAQCCLCKRGEGQGTEHRANIVREAEQSRDGKADRHRHRGKEREIRREHSENSRVMRRSSSMGREAHELERV